MGGLEVAGVVGTWVAAGVAIIALVGIAGPILIWRASRTERHRALAAIGDDNNGYMSKGIRLGPNTYLGQRIRAPILKTIPRLTDKGIKWSSASLKETRSPSTWVQFGAALNAYGVIFSRGDSLVIKHGKALLPVHPLWVLSIGLLGRYSERRDKGKFGSAKRSGKHRLPGPERARDRGVQPGDVSHQRDWEWRQETDSTLCGVTGSFKGSELHGVAGQPRLPVVTFELYPAPDLLQIQPEAVSLKVLFMLAMGCMQFADGQYFFLTGSSDGDADSRRSDGPSDEYEEFAQARVPQVSRFNDGPVKSGPHRPSYHHRSAGSHRVQQQERENFDLWAFQLSLVDLDSSMIAMVRPFADIGAEEVYDLKRTYNRSLLSELKRLEGLTYVPADSNVCRFSELTISTSTVDLIQETFFQNYLLARHVL